VLNHLHRDPGHVGRSPSEHIIICLEESNELEFLLRRKVGPDMSDLIGIGLINVDRFGSLVSSYDFL
jgi:hypothetical protein